MGANDQSKELTQRLAADEPLRLRGFTFSCGPTGGVVVDRWNHVRGVWHYHEGNFYWMPAGYNEPSYRTADIEQALTHTHNVICRS